jgi:hypothetical protein
VAVVPLTLLSGVPFNEYMQIDYIHVFTFADLREYYLHYQSHISEPALLPIISILGLILLPVLLGRGSKSR